MLADIMIWPFSATSSEALHQSRGLYRVSSTHPPPHVALGFGPQLTIRRLGLLLTAFLTHTLLFPPMFCPGPTNGAPLVRHL